MADVMLAPCARPGMRQTAGDAFDDWWREPHVSCTGSQHLSPDVVVGCSCPCHTSEPVLRCPKTYDVEAECTCWDHERHLEQAMTDAAIEGGFSS